MNHDGGAEGGRWQQVREPPYKKREEVEGDDTELICSAGDNREPLCLPACLLTSIYEFFESGLGSSRPTQLSCGEGGMVGGVPFLDQRKLPYCYPNGKKKEKKSTTTGVSSESHVRK